jgi:hypothetical protein
VDLFRGKTNVGDIRSDILIWNITFVSPVFLHLALVLRRLIFLCETAPGERHDLDGVGLRIDDDADDPVMSALGLCEARGVLERLLA